MARVVLVRHGQPLVEGDDPSRWGLSSEGRQAASALSQLEVWETIQRIQSSPQSKARETAQIVGDAWDVPVQVREDLREVNRPYEAAGYEDKLRAFLKGKAPEHWETREAAGARIRVAIRAISRGGVDVGVVSHGLLLTLFVAEVMGTTPTFWLHHSIGFGEYALYDGASDSVVQGFGGTARTVE